MHTEPLILMKLQLNCLTIMTIVTFEGKMGKLARAHHPICDVWGWQHYVERVLCLRRDWCTWHREESTLCGNIKAASQDISQEVAAKGLPNGK